MKFSHIPVMSQEVLEYLGPAPGGTYVDGTLGGGGHTLEILKQSAPTGRVIGLDRDDDALNAAQEFLSDFTGRVTLVRENFRNIKRVLADLGIEAVDGVILDLGVSLHQLTSPERGFSFMEDAPLNMRMDRRQELTAATIVNTFGERELARIFSRYGEERFSTRIARAIVKARAKRAIETTRELVEVIIGAVPKKFHGGRIHPATRVFQALRIEVNDELASLAEGLVGAIEVLKCGGRVVVISFHSLEDKAVKAVFRDFARGCVCPPDFPKCVCGRKPVIRILTKKVVVPSPKEVKENPRARSAKLRAAEKLQG